MLPFMQLLLLFYQFLKLANLTKSSQPMSKQLVY